MTEDALTEATWQAREENRAGSRDRRESSSEWLKTKVELLRHQVLLLAMRDGRAPLLVPRSLWRGLQRQGFLNNLYDLGSVARRLLFLGDSRMLLTELRTLDVARPGAEQTTPRETESASGDKSTIRG
jgi:hypothetical protein